MDEAYTLTDPQLMEICVRFAAIMGWIDAPPSADGRRMCEGYGGSHKSVCLGADNPERPNFEVYKA